MALSDRYSQSKKPKKPITLTAIDDPQPTHNPGIGTLVSRRPAINPMQDYGGGGASPQSRPAARPIMGPGMGPMDYGDSPYTMAAAKKNPVAPPAEAQLEADRRAMIAQQNAIRRRQMEAPLHSPERMDLADQAAATRNRGRVLDTLLRKPKPDYAPWSPAEQAFPDAKSIIPGESAAQFRNRGVDRLNQAIGTELDSTLNKYNDFAKGGGFKTGSPQDQAAMRSELERAQGMDFLPQPDIAADIRNRRGVSERRAREKEVAGIQYADTFGQERSARDAARAQMEAERARQLAETGAGTRTAELMGTPNDPAQRLVKAQADTAEATAGLIGAQTEAEKNKIAAQNKIDAARAQREQAAVNAPRIVEAAGSNLVSQIGLADDYTNSLGVGVDLSGGAIVNDSTIDSYEQFVGAIYPAISRLESNLSYDPVGVARAAAAAISRMPDWMKNGNVRTIDPIFGSSARHKRVAQRLTALYETLRNLMVMAQSRASAPQESANG